QDDDENWHVDTVFFTPLDGLADRSRRDRVPYDKWAEQGYIIATPSATVDYAFVARWLAEYCSTHNVVAIRFDRWRMKWLRKELAAIGVELPLVEFGQGFKDMTPALSALETELVRGAMRHGMNPVLTMCAANAVVTRDAAGNRKLDKSKATGRIDGMVALAMAIGGAKEVELEPTPDYSISFVG